MAIRKYSSGDVVGTYTVIEYTGNGGLIRCKCNQCGSIVEVSTGNMNKARMCKFCRTKYNTKPKQDLVGKKFGRLEVIESVVVDGHIKWRCRCDCGNEATVATCHLKSGHTKSCGCYMKEQTSSANYNDLTGKRFGRLTVLKPSDRHITPAGQALTTYLCKCDCGKTIEVLSMNLISGNTQSCGCIGSSLGEASVSEYLLAGDINFKRQYTFKDLKSNSRGGLLKFDFALLDKNSNVICLVEYNGEQHYYSDEKAMTTSFGKLQREETDDLKRAYCDKNGIKLFEIRFDEDINVKLNEIIRFYFDNLRAD